jgi:hypothetical protein
VPLRSFHRLARGSHAQLARVVVIAATGDRSHAPTRTTLDIELLKDCLRFFGRHTRHIHARQCRVEGLLRGRLGAPDGKGEDEARRTENQADKNHQSESSLPVNSLYSRLTAPHFSLYSMKGAPQSFDNFFAAGNERAASGRFTAMNGRGRGA